MSRARARRALVGAGLGLVVLLALAAPAAGRERTPVALELTGCVQIEQEAVRSLLSIELGERVFSSPAPAGATRAIVTCGAPSPRGDGSLLGDGSALAELRIDDAVTGKSLWRSIDLGASDAGVRARLLALALAELLFASWAELLVTPTPKVPPATPAVSPATRRATSVSLQRKLSPPLGVQLSATAAALVLLGAPRLSLGGGLRLIGEHQNHVGWDLDALYHRGSAPTGLGEVSVDVLSARLALNGHLRIPHLVLRGGVGGRLGAVRLLGEASDPAVTDSRAIWGAWGGPLGSLGLTAAAGRLRLDLSGEVGYVVSPVAARVNGVRAVAVEGVWIGVQLGLGAFLR